MRCVVLLSLIARVARTRADSRSLASNSKLQQLEPAHPFLLDLAEKELSFDVAAAKFGIAA